MCVLAISATLDGWSVFQLIFSALVSFVLVRLEMAQRRNDRLEDDRSRQVSEVRQKLEVSEDEKHRLVEKLVDQRLRDISHKISNEANGVLLSLKELKDKIHDTEKDFDRLSEDKHKLEVKTLEMVMELKDEVARREDMAATSTTSTKNSTGWTSGSTS
jgi:Na+-transporting NADH:ubiquinone oxidoreductase subunit NqrC